MYSENAQHEVHLIGVQGGHLQPLPNIHHWAIHHFGILANQSVVGTNNTIIYKIRLWRGLIKA